MYDLKSEMRLFGLFINNKFVATDDFKQEQNTPVHARQTITPVHARFGLPLNT